MLQCGDPTGTGTGGPGYGFGIENAPPDGKYPRGTLAMARTSDPNSNGSQFFLVYRDSQLPTDGGGYSIFGKVTRGPRHPRRGLAKGGSDNANGSGDGHRSSRSASSASRSRRAEAWPGADLVFRGGSFPCARTDGRPKRSPSSAAGSSASEPDVDDLVGPATEVVDLAGPAARPRLPGRPRAPGQGGVERARVRPHARRRPRRSTSSAIARVRRAPTPTCDVDHRRRLVDGGVPRRHAATASSLDEVVPDRPVFLPNRDHHGAWVNTRALELAGIDRDTPDPADGRIERDADGTPTGTLHEGAMQLVGRLLPSHHGRGARRRAARGAGATCTRSGITAWQDAIVGAYADDDRRGAAPTWTAPDDGLLTARVVGALWWDRDARRRADRRAGRAARAMTRAGRFRADVGQDHAGRRRGELHRRDARALPRRLRARRPTTTGISFVDPAALREYVTALDADGFQVHFHAHRRPGRARGARRRSRPPARANGADDHRHHLAHLQVVHPDDVPRFAELGVAANMQPLWAAHEPQMDDLTIPFLGPERASLAVPVRRPAPRRAHASRPAATGR